MKTVYFVKFHWERKYTAQVRVDKGNIEEMEMFDRGYTKTFLYVDVYTSDLITAFAEACQKYLDTDTSKENTYYRDYKFIYIESISKI